jgi:hypothetical protein
MSSVIRIVMMKARKSGGRPDSRSSKAVQDTSPQKPATDPYSQPDNFNLNEMHPVVFVYNLLFLLLQNTTTIM